MAGFDMHFGLIIDLLTICVISALASLLWNTIRDWKRTALNVRTQQQSVSTDRVLSFRPNERMGTAPPRKAT